MPALEGLIAVVTGACGEIGRATCARFAAEGAHLVLVDLDVDALSTLTDQLPAGRALAIAANVADEADVQRFIHDTLSHFGRLDVLFNNAGIGTDFAPIFEQDPDHFDRVIRVNLRSVFLGLRFGLPPMIEAGRGSIINTSSIAGLRGSMGTGPYVASKHGVTGLTRTAALDTAPYGIRVNSIHPSPVEGPMMRGFERGKRPDDPDAARALNASRIPLGRYAHAEDVAALATFLASDESRFITGSQYRVDGGMGAG